MTTEWVDISYTNVIAWTFFHSIWQGVGALIFYLAFSRILGSPSARYRLGLLCLVGFVSLQVCTFLYCMRWSGGTGITSIVSLTSDVLAKDADKVAANYFGEREPVELPTPSWLIRHASLLSPILFWISCAWIVGFWLYGLRYALATWLLRRELDRCVPVACEEQDNYRKLASRLDLDGSVQFLQTTELSVPATCGWLRPVVLVPEASLLKLPARFMDAIILHELAHIQRRDSLTHLIRQLIETLYFFHPLMRLLGGRMTDESEKAADEIAMNVLGDRKTYTSALVLLEEARVDMLKLGANGGSLRERVLHLIATREAKRQQTGKLSLLALILCSMLLILAAGEVVVRAASPDQRLLTWVSERDYPTAVCDALRINQTHDGVSSVLADVVEQYTQSGVVATPTLEALAAGVQTGAPASLWYPQSSQHAGAITIQGDITRFGTPATRLAIAGQLSAHAAIQTDDKAQARLARAAYLLMCMEYADGNALEAGRWIGSAANFAMLHVDADTGRQLDFAEAMRRQRVRAFKQWSSTGTGADFVNGPAANAAIDPAVIDAIVFLPGVHQMYRTSATPEMDAAIRTRLSYLPPSVRRRCESSDLIDPTR